MIAITLTIEGLALELITKFIQVAKREFNFSFIADNGYAPHLTLACEIQDSALEEAKDVCKCVALNSEALRLGLRNISMMCNENPLLYIRWEITQELLALRYRLQNSLRNRLGSSYTDCIWDNEEWLAKTSLIGFDTSYDYQLLNAIKLARRQFSGGVFSEIKSLTIIRYGTGSELKLNTYPLGP